VKEGIVLCKENDVGAVIALGGGSAMDCAKAVAAGVLYPGDPWNMIEHGQKSYLPPTESLPTMMIPTLAATGSEANTTAVITNRETQTKSTVGGQPCMFPRVCLADPALTCSVPARHTAYGAVDTISHVLESYINGVDDTPLQDRFQEGVMLTVIENTPRAIAHPDDVAARAHLQWASIVAQNGWAQIGSGAAFCIHHIEHVVSALSDIAHGAGLAILIPAFMKVAHTHRLEKYRQFADRVFGINPEGRDAESVARDGIACLEGFFSEIGVATRFRELGIGPEIFERIADDAIRVSGTDGRLGGRPRLDRAGILQVLELAK
jgi:alcohol dehydrogenase YqhD (iron-dependent ADH family)